jgi:hypothetical protein
MSLVLALVGSTMLAAMGQPQPVPSGPVVQQRLALEARPMAPQQAPFRYSEAYYRRLAIHRAASYAILPLFAFQFAAGLQLYEHGQEAPGWAREGHPIGAIGIAALFATNGVTGVMNLWEGRRDPDRPTRTVVHGVLMLAAGAGFTATGFLADEAKRTMGGRRTHRTVAITSMGIATVGYLSMLDVFR